MECFVLVVRYNVRHVVSIIVRSCLQCLTNIYSAVTNPMIFRVTDNGGYFPAL